MNALKPILTISIHAPRTGSDNMVYPLTFTQSISIHAPRTGSDYLSLKREFDRVMISIHAPRTGSDPAEIVARFLANISIHAPRTGSDPQARRESNVQATISIHAPRTGSDSLQVRCRCSKRHFNPRSPHGERRSGRNASKTKTLPISIHAPRTGSDSSVVCPSATPWTFQSTLPARGATESVMFPCSCH